MMDPVRRRQVWTFVVSLVILAAPASAPACSTPVFRYAMYNWATTPYVVLYLHHGQPAEEDAPVNQLLEELAQQEPPANVAIESVDLDKEDALKGYPEPVQAVLEGHAEVQEPQHVVISPWPWLAEVYSGRLDEAQVKSMIESPARKKLADLLDQGHAAVMLFVPGKDEEQNKKAREVITQVIDQTASGKLFPDLAMEFGGGESWTPPEASEEEPSEGEAAAGGTEPSEEGAEQAGGTGLKLAMLEVSRTDPAEAWLIRTLMSVEPDLKDYADEPMVFGIYGRGRAMPPYVGKGISVDLLADLVAFLLGPCSCTVKAQNPGMDLLVRWDWDATADRMAANDPSLYPDPMMYDEVAVGETGAGAEAGDEAVAGEATASQGAEAAAKEATGQPERPVAAADQEAAEGPEVGSEPVPGVPGVDSQSAVPAASEISLNRSSPPVEGVSGDDAGSFTAGMTWRLGLGLAVGAVLVLGAGFVLIRKQG